MRRKSDPSRVAERDRRAAGHGDRVAPRDCADAGLGLPARTGGGQAFGTAGCSRCGHGRRPRRWRRAGRTGDRFAGGAGRPRRRSAQGRLRLDSAPNPWHNSRDWLGLSELETVTRAPDGTPGPHPTPESVSYATRTRRPSPAPGLWTLTLLWTQRARPQGACKTAQTRFCTAPTATILVGSSRPGRDGTTGRQRRQPSRFAHFFMTADTGNDARRRCAVRLLASTDQLAPSGRNIDQNSSSRKGLVATVADRRVPGLQRHQQGAAVGVTHRGQPCRPA